VRDGVAPGAARARGIECAAVLIGLAIAVAAVYARSLDGPFVYDDHGQILANRAIQIHELSLGSLFYAATQSPSRRPVANLSFALNDYFGGSDPRGYHGVNVALHAIASALVYALARIALRRRPSGVGDPRLAAALAALVFALHPLQTQSVSYVVQRMNLLCALFYLAGLLCYAIARELAPQRRALGAAGALVCGALALGSKQNAITLPAAIALWEWFLYRDFDAGYARRLARRALPLLLPVAVLGYWWMFQGPHWGFNAKDFTLAERVLSQGRAIALYASLVLWPLPSRLNLIHDFPVSHALFDPPSTALAWLGILGIAWLLVVHRQRAPWAAFALLWFLLHLALESSVLPLDLVYEHRVYLPLAGVALALAIGLARALRSRPRSFIAVAASLAALLASLTWQRNAVWADPVALWSDVVQKNPGAALARSDLASALAHAGREREALAEAERALSLDPRSPRLHANLGVAYLRLGREARAEYHLARALAALPQDAELRGSLGIALLRRGQRERAREELERAAASDPNSARAAYNLAMLAREESRSADARAALTRALSLDPRYFEALGALAELDAGAGDWRSALQLSRRAEGLAHERGDRHAAEALRARRERYEAGAAATETPGK
jgi:Flp pilus assembly protein TadD